MSMDRGSHAVVSPKKIIEVALPLDAINAAAAALFCGFGSTPGF